MLLLCTSAYPAPANESNLKTMSDMKKRYQCEIGVSDHTKGFGVSVGAVGLGATVVEKHFCLSTDDNTPDVEFSLAPDEFRSLVFEANQCWNAIGEIRYGPTAGEINSRNYRRSIYAIKDLAVGEYLSEDNIRCMRPGGGLEPKYFESILGKKINVSVGRGTAIDWPMINRN